MELNENIEVLEAKEYTSFIEGYVSSIEIIAGRIRKFMDKTGITKVGEYSIVTTKTRTGDEYAYLAYKGLSMEDIDREFYYAGDFDCFVNGATVKMALKFVEELPQIFEELRKKYDEICDKTQHAMNTLDVVLDALKELDKKESESKDAPETA